MLCKEQHKIIEAKHGLVDDPNQLRLKQEGIQSATQQYCHSHAVAHNPVLHYWVP